MDGETDIRHITVSYAMLFAHHVAGGGGGAGGAAKSFVSIMHAEMRAH